MSKLGIIIKGQLGVGYSTDKSDVPVPYRVPTPTTVQGVQPTTPVGAPLTDSQVGTIPLPI